MELNELYSLALKKNITVDEFRMSNNKIVSLNVDDSFFIAMDSTKIDNEIDEKMCLSHEIGHCESGAFYMTKSKFETIERCEAKALRWQIKALIPEEKFDAAIEDGYTECWQIAEYLDVSEKLVREAYHYYKEIKR